MTDPYDILIIGAGSGGLTAADFGIQLSARVALVEKHRVGGDCTWTGCVPSKALLRVAEIAHNSRQAERFGVSNRDTSVNMAEVRAYVQQVIADIYAHETPEVLQGKGIDMLMGAARFVDPNTVEVNGEQVRAKHIVIATGAHPFIPPIPGLADVPYLTHEQIFDLETLPNRLLIIGAGPVGTEMAQAWQRLGSQVTLFDERILPRESRDVSDLMADVFANEGIQFVPALVERVSEVDGQIVLEAGGQRYHGDTLLVAAGRRPNVAGLSLEAAGVRYSEQGIAVDSKLRTSQPHIYAAGDVTGGPQQTHVAGYQAALAVRNILLPLAEDASASAPRTVYTSPEVGQIGLTEDEARAQYSDARVWRWSLDRVDRAVATGMPAGFVSLVARRSGKVLGATIVAPRAGEMLSEVAVMMANGLKLDATSRAMHPYPSYSMPLQQLGADFAVHNLLFDSAAGRFMLRALGLAPNPLN